ncbi:MAG: hypothetical protein JXL84_20570 [Deltaproteobacteria bacterium]|nr:hypothetical protein [Deltaproteobacteria bacterium]
MNLGGVDRRPDGREKSKGENPAICKRYYHPGFHGSFSVKSVLPALFPEMGYENLAIQDGQQAGLEYAKILDPSTPPEKRERIRGDILRYCGHDTLAQESIREARRVQKDLRPSVLDDLGIIAAVPIVVDDDPVHRLAQFMSPGRVGERGP